MAQNLTRFLASEYPAVSAEDALFHVIPAPLEQTVSYGCGTAGGPQAILDASYQLEAFDGTSCPGEAGIFTLPPVDCAATVEQVLQRIEAVVASVLQQGKIPVLVGGEHSLTLAPVRAMKATGREFGVVQFDAHADLRDSYEGTAFSHACVMRRVAELDVQIFQIGVRNLCREEVGFRRKHGIPALDAIEIARHGVPSRLLPEDFPQDIYVTFDVDGLDASLMPATGTPEPGGLFWWQAIEIIERIHSEGRRIIGLDVVELAPIEGMHGPNYTAAKLTYALMGFAARGQTR